MSLWNRIRNIRQARNSAGETTETPEQSLDRALREMHDALKEAHVHFAELTAFERKVAVERDKAQAKAQEYEANARRHALTGRDDLACDALNQKAEWDQIAAEYQDQWEKQHRVVAGVEQQIHDLKRQYSDAERNRELLLARQRAVAAQQRVSETLQNTQSIVPLAEMRDMEARADAEAELSGWLPVERPASTPRPIIRDVETEIAELRDTFAQGTPPPALPVWFPEETNMESLVEKPPRSVWFEESPKEETEASPLRQPHDLPNVTTLMRGANISLPIDDEMMTIAFGWEEIADESPIEIDACALLLSESGKTRGVEDFIFFNNRRSSCGGIRYEGKTFSGDSDNETMTVTLLQIAPSVIRILFALSLYEAQARRQTFQLVPTIWLRIRNDLTNSELASYLHTEVEPDRAIVLGELYRYRNSWKFRALGQGFVGGLPALLENYGIPVQ